MRTWCVIKKVVWVRLAVHNKRSRTGQQHQAIVAWGCSGCSVPCCRVWLTASKIYELYYFVFKLWLISICTIYTYARHVGQKSCCIRLNSSAPDVYIGLGMACISCAGQSWKWQCKWWTPKCIMDSQGVAAQNECSFIYEMNILFYKHKCMKTTIYIYIYWYLYI